MFTVYWGGNGLWQHEHFGSYEAACAKAGALAAKGERHVRVCLG